MYSAHWVRNAIIQEIVVALSSVSLHTALLDLVIFILVSQQFSTLIIIDKSEG